MTARVHPLCELCGYVLPNGLRYYSLASCNAGIGVYLHRNCKDVAYRLGEYIGWTSGAGRSSREEGAEMVIRLARSERGERHLATQEGGWRW